MPGGRWRLGIHAPPGTPRNGQSHVRLEVALALFRFRHSSARASECHPGVAPALVPRSAIRALRQRLMLRQTWRRMPWPLPIILVQASDPRNSEGNPRHVAVRTSLRRFGIEPEAPGASGSRSPARLRRRSSASPASLGSQAWRSNRRTPALQVVDAALAHVVPNRGRAVGVFAASEPWQRPAGASRNRGSGTARRTPGSGATVWQCRCPSRRTAQCWRTAACADASNTVRDCRASKISSHPTRSPRQERRATRTDRDLARNSCTRFAARSAPTSATGQSPSYLPSAWMRNARARRSRCGRDPDPRHRFAR